MISKKYSKTGKSCRVTFKYTQQEENIEVNKMLLLGDFNDWGKKDVTELTKRKDGTFSATVSLDAGSAYKFRYLVNDITWLNDDNADSYAWNKYGSQDGVLSLHTDDTTENTEEV